MGLIRSETSSLDSSVLASRTKAAEKPRVTAINLGISPRHFPHVTAAWPHPDCPAWLVALVAAGRQSLSTSDFNETSITPGVCILCAALQRNKSRSWHSLKLASGSDALAFGFELTFRCSAQLHVILCRPWLDGGADQAVEARMIAARCNPYSFSSNSRRRERLAQSTEWLLAIYQQRSSLFCAASLDLLIDLELL